MTDPIAELPVAIRFVMATGDGTRPLRDVADHAHAVAEAWIEVSEAMTALANSIDDLVAPNHPEAPSE